MDRLKRLLGNCVGGKQIINKIRISSAKKQIQIDEKAAYTFLKKIDQWSSLRTNSPEEKKCVQEIIDLCFEPPISGEKTRKVKNVCVIDANHSIFWRIISVYILIPKNHGLRKILGEILTASQITAEDWVKAQSESENITLILQK